MTYELTHNDVRRLQNVLVDLLSQSDADACLLCDLAGHVLAHENVHDLDPLLISALGAGVFAATGELARLLGEDEFCSVLHQGKDRSILIGAANEDVLLVVLFSGIDKTGLVKLYTPVAATTIRGVFEGIKTQEAAEDLPDRNFVLNTAGNIFGVNTEG